MSSQVAVGGGAAGVAVHGDVEAGLRQRQGDGTADPLGAAGDQRGAGDRGGDGGGNGGGKRRHGRKMWGGSAQCNPPPSP